jgi:hypothetical protein
MKEVEQKANKYIDVITKVFSNLKATNGPPLTENLAYILDTAKRYVEDARYYLKKRDSSTALTSVSYAEGLIDALRFLKLIDFEWPDKRSEKIA